MVEILISLVIIEIVFDRETEFRLISCERSIFDHNMKISNEKDLSVLAFESEHNSNKFS